MLTAVKSFVLQQLDSIGDALRSPRQGPGTQDRQRKRKRAEGLAPVATPAPSLPAGPAEQSSPLERELSLAAWKDGGLAKQQAEDERTDVGQTKRRRKQKGPAKQAAATGKADVVKAPPPKKRGPKAKQAAPGAAQTKGKGAAKAVKKAPSPNTQAKPWRSAKGGSAKRPPGAKAASGQEQVKGAGAQS